MGILPVIFVLLPLLVLKSLGNLSALSSGVVTSHNPGGDWVQPSHATLDGYPKSCGNVSFGYPFGIGSRCSRGSDFNLTCNNASHPPRLFSRDNITEVIHFDDPFFNINFIKASFSHTIPMQPGVSVYNLSLVPPGRSFSLRAAVLKITGCDLNVYSIGDDATMLICSTVCLDPNIPEMVAMHNCKNTSGCCRVDVDGDGSFRFKFVYNQSKSNIDARSRKSSQLWDRISITSDWPTGFLLL
nr:uncharacterized protein LOC120962125 [Aegilops tauschii subsp. strangulata]